MKQEMKKFVGIAAIVFGLFLAIRYWPNIEGIISLGIGAAVPLVVGCIMAYVINILMSWYEKWYTKFWGKTIVMKFKRIICLVLAILSLMGIIFLVINLVLPELINCIASFIALVPGMVEKTIAFIQDEQLMEKIPQLKEWMDSLKVEKIVNTLEQFWNTFKGSLGGAVGSIMSAVSSVFSTVVGIVVGLIFSFYVMYDKEKFGRQAHTLITTYMPKKSEKIFYVLKVLNESFHSFIVGQCTEAVVLGALCVAGMLLLRLPNPVMIGVFIGFTALIPIAGAYIGAIVGAIIILTSSPLQAVQFLIFVVVLQQLEGNLIYPKVVGKSIGLPGIWVLTAVTVGGGIMGIPGMLIAVPLFAAGYRLIKEDVARRNPSTVESEPSDKAIEKGKMQKMAPKEKEKDKNETIDKGI